jgi:hypothetical protein
MCDHRTDGSSIHDTQHPHHNHNLQTQHNTTERILFTNIRPFWVNNTIDMVHGQSDSILICLTPKPTGVIQSEYTPSHVHMPRG